MTFELPKDLLNRSGNAARRTDHYGDLTQEFTNQGHEIGWDRKRSEVDQIMEKPIVWGTVVVVGALGFALLLAGNFASGFFFLVMATGPATYIVVNLRRARSIEDRVIAHNLDIDRMRESARNAVRMSFPTLELTHAANESQIGVREMELALESVYADAYLQIAQSNGQVWAAMTKQQQSHELAKLDKNQLLEEAKGRVRVNELNAGAEASREEIKVRFDLDVRKVKEDLYAEQERFNREMTRLDKDHSQAARMHRMNEITQLRKTVVAAQQELRNNPALTDQLTTLIGEIDLLQAAMQSKEPLTIEDHQRQELIDQMLTRFLLKRHGVEDDKASA